MKPQRFSNEVESENDLPKIFIKTSVHMGIINSIPNGYYFCSVNEVSLQFAASFPVNGDGLGW